MAWKNSSNSNTLTNLLNAIAACRRTVGKSKYKQVVSDAWLPTGFLDGKPMGFRREVVRFTTEETVDEWVGLDSATANKMISLGDLSTLDSLGRGTFIQWTARRANEAGGWTVTRTAKTITQEISES